ncbi:hypothetical protein [Microvirga massiliensis]
MEALKAVHEFRQECSHTAVSGDWRIEVTDAFGAVAFQIALGELLVNQ